MRDVTAGELAERLAELDPDTPVRFAGQPGYPLEYGVSDLLVTAETSDDEDVVYLAESRQVGYLSSAVSAELGWSR